MPVYIEAPPPGKWHGKKRAAPKPVSENATPLEKLFIRLDGAIKTIESNEELDDEMRHTLLTQALTYEDFLTEVHGGVHDPANEQVITAMASITSFCELIEAELT